MFFKSSARLLRTNRSATASLLLITNDNELDAIGWSVLSLIVRHDFTAAASSSLELNLMATICAGDFKFSAIRRRSPTFTSTFSGSGLFRFFGRIQVSLRLKAIGGFQAVP